MQHICSNKTLFFVLALHESQSSRCLFSPHDFCSSPAFLFVPSLCPAPGFPPVYTTSSWPTNKHWRRFSEGREDTEQRGRTVRRLNNCSHDLSVTPTHHTAQTATHRQLQILQTSEKKKKCEVEGNRNGASLKERESASCTSPALHRTAVTKKKANKTAIQRISVLHLQPTGTGMQYSTGQRHLGGQSIGGCVQMMIYVFLAPDVTTSHWLLIYLFILSAETTN